MSKRLEEVNPFIIWLLAILTIYQGMVFRSNLDWEMKLLFFAWSFGILLIALLFEFVRSQEEERRWQEKVKL